MKYINELKSWGGKVVDEAGAKIGSKVKDELKIAVDDIIKKHGKKALIGVGGVSLAGSGVGSYLGTRAGNRKKKIKESNLMLFSFAIGMNSACSKERGGDVNCLIQEALLQNLRRALWPDKKLAAIAKIKATKAANAAKSVLSPERLGKAMHENPAAMNQAFKIYGPKSETMKKAMPTAFGAVRRGQ